MGVDLSLGDVSRRLADETAALADECVHCGFCLPACPTYTETGTEMDSPRGRIWLIRNVSRGRIEPTDTVRRHLDLCLDCRACETACPSGVRYGELIERSRAVLAAGGGLRRWLLRHVLPHRRRLAVALLPLRLWGALGLRRLARRLPQRLRWAAAVAPRVRGRSFLATAPETVPATGERRARVLLFTGCIMNSALAPLHRATVRVLAANGCDVLIPRDQGCCGALHVHDGDRETARALALRNVTALDRTDVDAIVVNAAGCGAQLREYVELLGEDDGARRVAERTVDATAFLAKLGPVPPPGEIRGRAVYDEPCHLLHAQAVSGEPRDLLASIPGLETLPLEESDRCCGGAGIYNLTQPEMSRRLLQRKIDRVADAGADLLVTANPGCLFQLQAGVEARGLDVEVVHLLELLDRSYSAY